MKESSVWEKFKVAPNEKVTVKEGRTISVQLENQYRKGDFRLLKTQDYGDLIDGAIFVLKSISFEGYEREIAVAGGELKVKGIPVGTYSLREIDKPEGYDVLVDMYEVIIEEDKLTERIVVNKLEPKGEIVITKTDEEDGSFIEGTEFTLIVTRISTAPSVLKNYTIRETLLPPLPEPMELPSLKGFTWGNTGWKRPRKRTVTCHLD